MNEETEEMEENRFMDKIKFSDRILDKEGQLNGAINSLISKMNNGFITLEILNKDADKPNDYVNSWRLVNELYMFMKHNRVKDFKKRYEEECKELKEIIRKYLPNSEGKVTFEDLLKAVDYLTHVISLAGYHEDKTGATKMDDAPQYW